MNFGQAIEALKQGKKVKRAAWLGYWFMGDCLGSPAIIAKLRDEQGHAPASPYQTDLLAEDWELAEEILNNDYTPKELEFKLLELRQKIFCKTIGSSEYMQLVEEFKVYNRMYAQFNESLLAL